MWRSLTIFGFLRIELFTIARATAKPLIFLATVVRASFFHNSQMVVGQRDQREWNINREKISGKLENTFRKMKDKDNIELLRERATSIWIQI